MKIESLLLNAPRGLMSRIRLFAYRLLGMKQGSPNRMEGGGRCRRLSQIEIGRLNAFTQGCWLWPENTDHDGIRIRRKTARRSRQLCRDPTPRRRGNECKHADDYQ